jgi:hypothetical protein
MTGTDDPSEEDLLKVCRLLNQAGARYLVIGGFAMALHQVPRFTHDVDLLIEDDEANFQRVITALSGLADGAARELQPKDFRENLVVKVAGEVEVDVRRRAWVVTYAEALPGACETVIDGVRIPFLGLNDLIRSKQTRRAQDEVDVASLVSKWQSAKVPVNGYRPGCTFGASALFMLLLTMVFLLR